MVSGPRTVNGKMLGALARRDDAGFTHWRAEMNQNEMEQGRLYAMCYGAFREAVELRFPVDYDPRDVTRFLSQPYVPLWEGARLPFLEADALIRSALGETGLVGGIPSDLVGEIRMQLFVYLVEDLSLTAEAVNALLERAEAWVASESS
jgi:hypothetical protein